MVEDLPQRTPGVGAWPQRAGSGVPVFEPPGGWPELSLTDFARLARGLRASLHTDQQDRAEGAEYVDP